MLDLELTPGDKVHVGAALNGGLMPMEIKLAVNQCALYQYHHLIP